MTGSASGLVDLEALGPAHTALFRSWRESRMDLKLSRKTWCTHPFRFAAELAAALSERVAADSSATGRTLTAAQYVDAAMARHLPTAVEDQLALAESFLLSRDCDVGTGQQGSHRVSPAVFALASTLPNELRRAGHARTAVHVYSAALDRFLDELQAEAPRGHSPR
ncbi:hypothetical protein ACIQWN_37100 [Streptomyces vinaceus]|uniref:hypothetical protein n=1 Tax=Streptomyces vinaceus TaxID=1960 RepID=UPI00381E04C0